MDPLLDPPPVIAQPAVVIPASTATAVAANPASVQPAANNHPPYAEMISAAIAALKERDGSSKRAISRYIETQYSDLPPTHSALLTHHLKRLKTSGQLLMVKYSYKLPGPRSAPAPVNGALIVESSDPTSAVVKRRPGRPPKPKPESVQAAVPVFPAPINMNDESGFPPELHLDGNVAVSPENAYIAVGGPVNGAAVASPVRGRGRPPKRGAVKRGPGRPPMGGGVAASGGGKNRGRPRKNAASISTSTAVAARGRRPGRPRGRPPKPINVVEGFGPGVKLGVGVAAAPFGGAAPPVLAPLPGNRRGRPPKAGNEAKKPRNMNAPFPKPPRKLSGKPLGRPRKNAQATGNRTQDSQLLMAYLDLKAKLENLQSTVKQAAALVKPSLSSEAAINAIQELELVAANASAGPNVEAPQQPLIVLVQPLS